MWAHWPLLIGDVVTMTNELVTQPNCFRLTMTDAFSFWYIAIQNILRQ